MNDRLLNGEVFYLYAFDVADEIRTVGITQILAKKATPLEIQLEKNLPKSFHFYRPLSIDPRRRGWMMGGIPVHTVVRVYDVGVVSIVMSVPFAADALKELIPYHQPKLDNRQALDQAALELCQEVVESLRVYLVRGTAKVDIPEAYTVFALHRIADADAVEPWIGERRVEIAGLLAETDPEWLSRQQVDETFRHCISFDRDDVTVIDWDAALVVNLSGKMDDEIHVLELANLQLEELVLMDKRLDDYLERAYDKLEAKGSTLFGFGNREIKNLRRFRMDVAKITDEVSNISKFFGDWYLARIYLAARDRFHIPAWRESIHNRLNNLDTIYEVWRTETNEARMLVLEGLIVLLFIVDLVALFWLKK